MTEMNCETCQEKLVDLIDVIASRSDHECRNINAHLKGCTACSKIARELLEDFSLLGLSVSPAEVPADFEELVFEKIGAEALSGAREHRLQPNSVARANQEELTRRLLLPTSLRWISYGLAASLLFLVAGGQWFHLKRIETAAIASRDPSEEDRVASLERAVAEMRELQIQSQKPEVRYISFQPQGKFVVNGAKPDVAAHAVWDSLAGQIHFFGFDIAPLGPGETYAIWYQVAGEHKFARQFAVGDDGLANFVIETSVGKGEFPGRIVVSIERLPIGDSPSDQVWLAADIN